jgi:hypothetical protein
MDALVRDANDLITAGLPDEADQRALIDLLSRVRRPLL